MTTVESCRCHTLGDLAVIDMGEHGEVFLHLVKVAERGSPWWWLYASRCGVCEQTWLIAQEERQNDVFVLLRLNPDAAMRLVTNNEWPDAFDRYETLLEIGRTAGRKMSFVDPFESSLQHTIADLGRERPGIRVSELATLLNLEPGLAARIARMVVDASDVSIRFDEA